MLILSQQKEEGIIQYQDQIYIPQVFHRTFISNRNKTEILVNKPVYLGLPILELSKISMYERHGEKPKHCFLDTDSFIVQV